jgi:trehalose 6-phosphate phosphatase
LCGVAGIITFLQSRGIELPRGQADDDEDMDTVIGLGNKKNQIFNLLMKEKGVIVYRSTIELIKVIHQLLSHALKRPFVLD